MRAPSLGLAPVVAVLAFFGLAACGDDGDDGGDNTVIDAAIDAADEIDAPGAPTCADYCTTITANCSAANLMYGTAAECMATCALFDPAATMTGNTLGCRVYHAGNAAGSMQNANTHCRHAGPGGDGVCGANCAGFCTIVMGACAGQNPLPYADMAACMTACGNYATTPVYSATVTGGNSFACRLYHATAASANPGLHCPHTAMVSATCQ
jgi:hypothetical protein